MCQMLIALAYTAIMALVLNHEESCSKSILCASCGTGNPKRGRTPKVSAFPRSGGVAVHAILSGDSGGVAVHDTTIS